MNAPTQLASADKPASGIVLPDVGPVKADGARMVLASASR